MKQSRAWLDELWLDTLNGTFMRGYLILEARLRTLLETFVSARFKTSSLRSPDIKFNVAQLFELCAAVRIIPEALRPSVRLIHKLRNRIAHQISAQITITEIASIRASLPVEISTKLPTDEEPNEMLRILFLGLLAPLDSFIARVLADAELERLAYEDLREALRQHHYDAAKGQANESITEQAIRSAAQDFVVSSGFKLVAEDFRIEPSVADSNHIDE